MFWYVSRSNEILIDTDNFSRSIAHTDARLHGAIQSGKLSVEMIEFHESSTKNHMHTLITLKQPMQAIERYVWAIILHGDIYRGCATIMRELKATRSADVLITPSRFLRNPDDECHCKEKHKAEIMLKCPAAIRLRGTDRMMGFFGKPIKRDRTFFDGETTCLTTSQPKKS